MRPANREFAVLDQDFDAKPGIRITPWQRSATSKPRAMLTAMRGRGIPTLPSSTSDPCSSRCEASVAGGRPYVSALLRTTTTFGSLNGLRAKARSDDIFHDLCPEPF